MLLEEEVNWSVKWKILFFFCKLSTSLSIWREKYLWKHQIHTHAQLFIFCLFKYTVQEMVKVFLWLSGSAGTTTVFCEIPLKVYFSCWNWVDVIFLLHVASARYLIRSTCYEKQTENAKYQIWVMFLCNIIYILCVIWKNRELLTNTRNVKIYIYQNLQSHQTLNCSVIQEKSSI